MSAIEDLRAAGFSDQEVTDWMANKSQQLTNAGFGQSEIQSYFGIKQPNDDAIRKTFDDNLKQYVEANGERPLSFTDAIDAGLQMSTAGLAARGRVPDKYISQSDPWYNRIAFQTAQMIGDVPAMVAGAIAGGTAGIETGPGTAITATAGAFALPSALRSTMIDAYQKGEFKTFPDFWDRASGILLDTAKSWITGAATGSAGIAAGTALEATTPVIKSAGQLSAEIGTMTTVGKALEGKVPNLQDFTDAAIVLFGAKGAMHGTSKLIELYRQTGTTPAQVMQDAKTDPTIMQDLATDHVEVPKAYTGQVDPMFKAEDKPPADLSPAEVTLDDAQKAILDKIQVGGETPKDGITLDRLYTLALDDLNPIKNAVDAMSNGKEIPADQDPYVIARTNRGIYGKSVQFLEHSPFDFNTYENVGKSFQDIVSPLKDDLDGFRAYLAANRAVELEGRGIKSGFDSEAARQVVEKGGKYASAAKELIDYQDNLTKYLRDAGVLSNDAYTAMRDANKNYVPFYRVFEDANGSGVGKGLKTANPIKGIKGSERSVIDPLESVIKNTYAYITLAERNAVGKAFVDLANKSGTPEEFITKLPPTLQPTKVSTKEMEKFLDSQGIDEAPKELMTVFRAIKTPLRDDEIAVFKDGKRTVYQVNPEVGRVFNALDQQSSNVLMKILSEPARVLRAGATLTPDFMARNILRDQVTAFAFSKEGFIPIYDTMRGVMSIFKKDEDFQNWMKSGGANSTMVSMDRQYIQSELFKLVGNNPEADFLDKTWNLAKKPIDFLRITSELFENATRLGDFKRGIAGTDATKADILSAGFDSREVTLDFARVGAKMRAMNQITAFFNAQVQGTDRAIRAFHDDPLGTTAKVAAAITLPSVILWAANHDDERWKEIPAWQRDLFWIVMTEDHVYRIPKPFELGIIFGSGVERALDAMFADGDMKAANDFLKTMGAGIMPNYIPTAVQPALEQLTNYSFLQGHNLIPDYLNKMLPEYRYAEYTTQLTQALGHILGTVPAIKDTSTASPLVIDNYIRAWTGGLDNYALQIADAGLRKAKVLPDPIKPTDTLADIPIIKAFVVRYPSATAESIQRFREDYQGLAMRYNTVQQLAKDGNAAAAIKVIQANPVAMAKLDNIEKVLGQQTQLVRMIYKNPEINADEKRQLVDSTYYQMIQMTKIGNDAMRAIRKSLN